MFKRFALILVTVIISVTSLANINIWEGKAHHHKVELIPYVATGESNIAVIVCPGGSYFWHDMHAEGHDVAKWLQRNGITAFVLKYRTGGAWAYLSHYRLFWRGNRYPDSQDDLLQALRYVRQHSQDYGISTNCVGAMGFSAGGHLVMSAAELFDKEDRPAFVAAIYPVVTMTRDCVHKRSRRGLLGDSQVDNTDLCNLLSLEKHVTSSCPPVFLVNCLDDPTVDYHNSALLDSALTANHVNHVYLQFASGGHGFGASETKGTPESRQWKNDFIKWINNIIQ